MPSRVTDPTPHRQGDAHWQATTHALVPAQLPVATPCASEMMVPAAPLHIDSATLPNCAFDPGGHCAISA